MVQLNFDANTVEPATGREPLPAGKYLVIINASMMKPTRMGNGQYLEFEYQVVTGPHKNRRVWSRHTLQHPNADTVSIARGELSAVCRAVGIMTPSDSSDLHNLPLTITVRQRQREDTQELTNEVTAWSTKDAMQGAPLQGAPLQAGAEGGPQKPAWMR